MKKALLILTLFSTFSYGQKIEVSLQEIDGETLVKAYDCSECEGFRGTGQSLLLFNFY